MDPKARFSSRVEDYIRYRPGYPPQVIATLREVCGLDAAWRVADIGSGTGLLARLFLDLGCRVWGIEPNDAMRHAGEQILAGYPNFTSQGGAAEATGLADASVDLVSAGQAFHWFDAQRARREFARILRPGGWVALVWNGRRAASSPFMTAYEALLQAYATDYNAVNHSNVEEDAQTMPAFFGGPYHQARFDNEQRFDFAGLRGRLLSSSYAPEAGHPNHQPMLAELRRIFDAHQQEGRVSFEYDTRLYYGKII